VAIGVDFSMVNCCTEPDYDFEKNLTDADAYEKETAEFECEVNDEEAPVQWFREDQVIRTETRTNNLAYRLKMNLLSYVVT
jgi:hypothetical protein